MDKIIYYIRQFFNYSLARYQTKQMKKKAAYFGNSKFHQGYTQVINPPGLCVGDNCEFMSGHWDCRGGLWIGDNVIFSRNVTILTSTHEYEGDRLPFDENRYRYKSVHIYDNVWVGMNVTILPGTTIGAGCIIGAGAVVCGDIPPLTIIGGAIGSKLKQRNSQHYNGLAGESGRIS